MGSLFDPAVLALARQQMGPPVDPANRYLQNAAPPLDIPPIVPAGTTMPFRPDMDAANADRETRLGAQAEARDVAANPMDRPSTSPFEPANTGEMQKELSAAPPPLSAGMLQEKPGAEGGAPQRPGVPQRPAGPPGTGAKPGGGGGGGLPGYEKDYLQQSDEIRKGEAETLGGRAATIDKIAATETAGLQVRTEMAAKAESERQTMETNRHLYETIAEDEAKSSHAEIQQMAAETRAMHVDPQKWFKDRGTGGTILAAIAMAMGAFGAGHGGQNGAQHIIDQSIDRDVKAQEGEIDKAWKAVDFKAADADKQYAHSQFKINAMRSAEVEKTSHAIAMIEQQRALTTDAVKIQALDDLKSNLDDKMAGLLKEGSAQHYDVMKRQAAAQAAAANAAAKDARDELAFKRKHVLDVTNSPDSSLSEEAKRLGIPLEEAAWRQADAAWNHNRAGAGLVRREHESKAAGGGELEKERLKTEQELKAQLATFGEGSEKKATAGTSIGGALSHALPGWLPGVEKGRLNKQDRDDYNANVTTAVGALYKWKTGSPEPKNLELIKELKEPYAILATDSDAVAAQKRSSLRAALKNAAAGAGVK